MKMSLALTPPVHIAAMTKIMKNNTKMVRKSVKTGFLSCSFLYALFILSKMAATCYRLSALI